jgi:acetyl esterase/lipase
VDPELAAGLANLPNLRDLGAHNVHAIRAQMTQFARERVANEAAPDIDFTEQKIPGPRGAPDVRILLYRPRITAPGYPALVHFHGGGLVFGSPEARHAVSVDLVRSFECVIASVDYRVAPEHRYPAALEDGYATLSWLHKNAVSLGIDVGRIAVIGESAGGGLAAALAILARQRAEFAVAAQVLTYPMLDDRPRTTEKFPHIGKYVWTRENNVFGWTSYLGEDFNTESVPETAAAARCTDFVGLPPAYLAIGDLDLFVVETITYARELLRAGARVDLRVYPGAFHGFDLIESAAISRRFKADLKASVGRALDTNGD